MENNLQQIILKLQDKLKPYIFEYISYFVPKDKIPEDKSGKTRFHCFNHHKTGKMDTDRDMQYYPETGTFHCYSCGQSYNIFTLANLFENKPLTGKEFFTENVKYLCDRYGIDTYELDNSEIGNEQLKYTEMYRIMGEISEYLTANVNEKFLNLRNINKKTAALFNVGSILDMQDFENYLKQFKPEILKEINILNDNGKINTMLFSKSKLILSLKNTSGNVVAFSSREMIYTINSAKKVLLKCGFDNKVIASIKKQKDIEQFIDINKIGEKERIILKKCINTPKYFLTKETEIFKKKEILFGYYELKNKFNKAEPVKIIEGYIDVMTAYQKGIYCLGVGGDKITEEQFDFLENKATKYINKVTLMFDNDNAGKEATYKYAQQIVEKLKEKELNNKYYVAKYLEEAKKDIDESLTIYNKITDFCEEITLFDYYMKESILNRSENEKEILNDFLKIISQEDSPLVRKEMIVNLYETLNKVAEIKNKVNNYSIKDLEQEVYYLVNKIDEEAQKLTINKLKETEKTIKTLRISEIKPALNSMIREIEDITDGSLKSQISIFERSINKMRHNLESKYTEDSIEFNCGYDMFNNRSWTGSELMILVSKPHIGKTQFMTNIARNFISLNERTAALYITTDDSARRIENNFIAQIGNLNKDFVNEPKNNKFFGLNSDNHNKMILQKEFRKASNVLEKWINIKRLVILESADGVKNLDSLLDIIEEFCNEKTIKDFQKLVILDSANKIKVSNCKDETERLQTISSELKTSSQANNHITIANFEARKFGSRRTRTTFNHIKGSASIEYDSDFSIVLSNPLAELTADFAETVWYKDDKKQPILVPYVAKSKAGGDIMKAYFYKIDNQTSLITEVDEDEEKNITTKWTNDNSNKEKGYVNE